MATLDIEHEDIPLPGGDAARVVRLRGSVDSATVARLDADLAELLVSEGEGGGGGEGRLAVLDLAETSYINSRGMAMLIKYHDKLKGAGGMLVLAGIPKKIAATLDSMGLMATFVVEPDVEAAAERLAGLRSEPEAAEAAEAAEDAEDGTFPLHFSCDACVASLVADASGKYRCPRCQACFEVTSVGEVVTFPVRSAQSVELNFPCRPEYVDVARAAAASVAKSFEIPFFSSEALDRAIDEAIGLYAGKAGDGSARIRMFVAADGREFMITFVATDPALALTKEDEEGLTFRTLKGIVDELVVEPLSPEGQALKLIKRFDY